MKKWQFISLIILGSLFGIYHILAITGVFSVYRNATWSNEPNIKEGEFIFTTNLIFPKSGDFVSYRFTHPDSLNAHFRIHRLVASENDILEIKEGILFVNGENFDKNYSLMHEYKISIEELKQNDIGYSDIKNQYFWMKAEDTIVQSIEDKIAKNNNLMHRKLIKPNGEIDELIKATYNKNWNKDNFGPFKIPLGKVFIMADNRDVSEDSRFIGPIDKFVIKGVLIQ